jgi:hypothetical protein
MLLVKLPDIVTSSDLDHVRNVSTDSDPFFPGVPDPRLFDTDPDPLIFTSD